MYYSSSFFFKERDDFSHRDDTGLHLPSSTRQDKIRNSGTVKCHHTCDEISPSSANTTPQQYYDYHFYHARPVSEQLQQSGKFTVLQAIYLTLSMGDLKDDLVELIMHVIDSFIISPSLRLKMWIKRNAN
jgi:hypothetical protein